VRNALGRLRVHPGSHRASGDPVSPYGAGLRLLECLRLRVKDVVFKRGELIVREGKGGKDRITMLPEVAAEPLRQQMEFVARLHEADTAAGYGRVF
jgi:integrase